MNQATTNYHDIKYYKMSSFRLGKLREIQESLEEGPTMPQSGFSRRNYMAVIVASSISISMGKGNQTWPEKRSSPG